MTLVLDHLQQFFASGEHECKQCLQCGVISEQVQSQRIFHGRGHMFPGYEHIVVDWFSPVLFVTLFEEPEPGFIESLAEFASGEPSVAALLLQRRYQKPVSTDCVWGSLPEQVFAQECEWRFKLQFSGRQNVGFFLDMRPGRHWLREHAAGMKVLNLFAYTCSLSVAALSGGAKKVVNLDMSKAALSIGRDNHVLNNVDDSAKYLPHELFRSISRLAKAGPFDIVVIDPPSFQPGSFVAKSDYARLVRRLPRLLRKGGLVLACLNAPNLEDSFIRGVFRAELPTARFSQRLTGATDFPDCNADRSLKLMVFVDGRDT